MSSQDGTLVQRLAEHVVQLGYTDLSEQVRNKAKAVVLDQLGCQLASSTLMWNRIVYDFVRGFGGRREAAIVNYGTRAPIQDAAFVNATFGQGCELDDYFRGGVRPGSATVPVAMAVAEGKRLDGKSFLVSVVAGYDVAWLLADAMMPYVLQRGFHGHMVAGTFAAAAVAGKLLGLDAAQLAHAFAIAGSHGVGTLEYDQSGGEAKRMRSGLVARGGIESAMLAKMGLTGPLTILEGKRGLLPLLTGQTNTEAFIQNLGRDFGVLHAAFKIYPAVTTLHCSIDALSELIEEHDFKAGDVERIEVGINDIAFLHGASIYEPRDCVSAQFSLPFSLAVRLLKKSNDLSLYADPGIWQDAQVQALAKKVHSHVNPEIPSYGPKRYAAKVRVILVNGRTIEKSKDYPRGSLNNPLNQEELENKFRDLASRVLPKEKIERIIATVNQVEELGDVGELVSLLVARREEKKADELAKVPEKSRR